MWAAKKFDSVLPNQRGSGGSSGQSGETVHKYLGKVDLKDTQQVEALKDSFCSSYANSKVENMMVITRNGEVHYMTDNNPRGVDCSYLGGKLKGSYNIHTPARYHTIFLQHRYRHPGSICRWHPHHGSCGLQIQVSICCSARNHL